MTSRKQANQAKRAKQEAIFREAFTGKVAIVTGGASGIGKAIGAALVASGATVILADVDEAGAKEAAHDMSGRGSATGVSLDVRDAAGFAELVERVAADHGHLDLLFNNAGIGVGGWVTDLTLAHWERVIDVNLRGVVHGVLAAYPVMIKQGSGHIVNTASMAGLVPGPMLAPYAMTKHAVVGLSTSVRAEAVGHGVKVSALCPGVIDTPILDKGNPDDLPEVASLPKGRGREELTRLAKAYPPDALAIDVLAGVVRNDPLIVAPGHARRFWLLYRLAPRVVIKIAGIGVQRGVKERSAS